MGRGLIEGADGGVVVDLSGPSFSAAWAAASLKALVAGLIVPQGGGFPRHGPRPH